MMVMMVLIHKSYCKIKKQTIQKCQCQHCSNSCW